jgi:hypothetical protein
MYPASEANKHRSSSWKENDESPLGALPQTQGAPSMWNRAIADMSSCSEALFPNARSRETERETFYAALDPKLWCQMTTSNQGLRLRTAGASHLLCRRMLARTLNEPRLAAQRATVRRGSVVAPRPFPVPTKSAGTRFAEVPERNSPSRGEAGGGGRPSSGTWGLLRLGSQGNCAGERI